MNGGAGVGKTQWGLLVFVAAAAFGPLYTAPGYSVLSNVISELAAQNTPRNAVMALAFVLMGGLVALDGLRPWRAPALPFAVFGVAFAAAGLFGHKPITPGVPYLVWADTVHSQLATVSGVALTVGFGWQAVLRGPWPHRGMAGLLALACVGLPLAMLALPAWQGAIQRLMYLLVFGWLFAFFPRRLRG